MTEPTPPRDPPLVLIVDHHEEYGEACADFLETCGFNTLLAYDTLHAIAVASQRPPDVIVTDIASLGTDGFLLVRAVKSIDALKDVPIVAVSDRTDIATTAAAAANGCAALLAKPCQPPHLFAAVSALIGAPSPG